MSLRNFVSYSSPIVFALTTVSSYSNVLADYSEIAPIVLASVSLLLVFSSVYVFNMISMTSHGLVSLSYQLCYSSSNVASTYVKLVKSSLSILSPADFTLFIAS